MNLTPEENLFLSLMQTPRAIIKHISNHTAFSFGYISTSSRTLFLHIESSVVKTETSSYIHSSSQLSVQTDRLPERIRMVLP